MAKKIDNEKNAETPVSSLIDVVFLLIMFFIVTTILSEEIFDPQIQMAKAKDMQPIKTSILNKIVINITEDQRIRLSDKKNISLNQLALEVRRVFALQGNATPVVIRIDRRTEFLITNQVLEVLKNLQASDIKISAEVITR